MGKVGRPCGYRESEATKLKRSKTLRAKKMKHDEDTRKKISEGVRKSREKIEPYQARDIVEIYDSREYPISVIAHMFGISEKYVYELVRTVRGINYDE